MLYIKSLDESLPLFKALGSEIRIEIIKILMNNSGMSMKELAAELKVTNGALTSHMKMLEDCGIVTTSAKSSTHGNQKICSVHMDKILIDLDNPNTNSNIYQTDVRIGQFSDYQVYPTCGIATPTSLIGTEDDIRYFAHPDRYNADILWFSKGYVEYIIPNFIPKRQKIDHLSLSLELSSEAPGINNIWPSDIHFYINNTPVGIWTSPGDFGDVRGIYTPDWWYPNWNQYGLLKLIVINHQGTFIDGLQVSDVSVDKLSLDYSSIIKFRIGVPDDAAHVGGITIFGKTFGNYNQDISVQINYSPCDLKE